MLRFIIGLSLGFLFAIAILSLSAQAEPVWSMGLGMESRVQRDVNPDESALRNMGELYVKMRIRSWAVLLESSQESRDSSSGSLRVQTASTSVGAWGRYEFKDLDGWIPFAGAGLGGYFDQVNTSFEDSRYQSVGTRGFFGIGIGIGTTFWKHLNVEGEARLASVQEEHQPVFSALLRVGYQI